MYTFFFRKGLIVSLDKALISRLGSCRALWSCIKTAFCTLKSLVTIEGHYMTKNPGMFSSKKHNFFVTEEKKTWTFCMTWWWGWVNYQEVFIFEVDLSFNGWHLGCIGKPGHLTCCLALSANHFAGSVFTWRHLMKLISKRLMRQWFNDP